MQHHLASSKRAGLTEKDWSALKDPARSGFSEKEKAALAYAEKLTRSPHSVGDGDIAALKKHFDDGEVVELTMLVGLINLTNRFTDPLGLELEMAAAKVQ